MTTTLFSVCMLCRRAIGPNHHPFGAALPAAPNQSHGLCIYCAPTYGAQMGLSPRDLARILSSKPSTQNRN